LVELSVNTYRSARRNAPSDSQFYASRRENPKFEYFSLSLKVTISGWKGVFFKGVLLFPNDDSDDILQHLKLSYMNCVNAGQKFT
jgi:hypothetical protein